MSHYNKTMKLNEANLLKTHIYNTISRKTNCYYKTPISKDNIDDEGTIKITKPGYYYLTEDIVFDIPQSTNIHDYLFTKPEKSEHLFGKHAGILIESDCVILDLCGHTISQSARFYAAQRFFNLIQFNNFPFIKNPDNKIIGDDTNISNSAIENSLILLILRDVYGFLFIKSSLKILLEDINSKGYLWRYLSSQFVKENILKPLFLKFIRIFF